MIDDKGHFVFVVSRLPEPVIDHGFTVKVEYRKCDKHSERYAVCMVDGIAKCWPCKEGLG